MQRIAAEIREEPQSLAAEPEFDRYAEYYSAACNNPFKRMLGSSARRYLEVKVDHLLRTLGGTPIAAGDPGVKFLDYGCGNGDFLSILRDRSVAWSMEGCDVSQGMLRAADVRHPEFSPRVPLWNCGEENLPVSSYDLITVVCVVHHIAPETLQDTMHQLWNALKPGGRLCVYEHNPWNPLTRLMIARNPIDQHAVLISQPELASHARAVGATQQRISNLLFFPPRFRFATRLEAVLDRIPIGGQYLMMLSKPA